MNKSIYNIGLLLFATLGMLVLLPTTAVAGQHEIVNVDNFHRGELYCRGFMIDKPVTLDIYAIGSLEPDRREMIAFGWIIKSGAMEPVWAMEKRNTDRMRKSRYLREYDRSIELEPGSYHVYYYAGPANYFNSVNIQIDGLGELVEVLADVFGDDADKWRDEFNESFDETLKDSKDYHSEKLLQEFTLQITSDSEEFSRTNCVTEYDEVIAEIRNPDHNNYSTVGFSISKPMEVAIVAVGEYSEYNDLFVDHGWIIDADSRTRVWSMERFNTDPAGGADKNRMAIDQVTLEKGDYVLFYVTDDSHCFDDWNAVPPYNPNAYGITVMATDVEDLKNVKPYKDSYSERAIIAITHLDNDEFEMQPFVVKKDCSVRIYAIGEYGNNDAFVDYAWLDKVEDDNPYWVMTKRNTDHAGGAEKNLCFNDIVDLEKGEYALCYITDDSHTYGDWNLSPPYDQSNYGVTLYAVGKDFDRSVIEKKSSLSTSDKVLAQIVRVGNDADEWQKFALDKPTKVRILAIGEGERKQMFDYGWIEEIKTGKIVWEMTYRMTRSAGGARKNRLVDDVVMLDAGKYEVRYVTDGSHSFERFNKTRPRNPHLWGITLTKEK